MRLSYDRLGLKGEGMAEARGGHLCSPFQPTSITDIWERRTLLIESKQLV